MKELKVNSNVEQTFKNRYLQPGENTIQDIIKRVSKFVANAEKNYGYSKKQIKELEDKYFQTMNQRLWIPSSPFLMNAGTKVSMLSACFALPIDDNMESIMNTLKDTAMVQKAGGGTGFNFSNLRAEGEQINSTGGTSSGVLSFMDIFNQLGSTIKQGGRRRSANIGILHISHPEIEKYIDYKNDHSKLTNFNISVLIDDKFMNTALNDEDYELISPKNREVVGTIKAKELWDKIVENNWKSAEPGLLFLDNMNKNNPTKSNLGLIDCVNPCVTGETVILTDKGYKRIDSLLNQKVNVWNGFEWSEVEPKITGYNQDIIDIKFSDGSKLSCTPYHGFILKDGTKVEAKDLKLKDKLLKYNFPVIEGYDNNLDDIAYTMGFYSGDGFYHKDRDLHGIWLYDEKKKLVDYLVKDSVSKEDCVGKLKVKLPKNINFNKEFVPNTDYSLRTRLIWLAGILDSDGSLNDEGGSLSIWSINRNFLMDIKFMLNTLGVNAVVLNGKEATKKMMPNGNGGLVECNCAECFRLIISASNVKRLMELGLKTNRVQLIANPNRDAGRFITIEKVELRQTKEVKVYCFNEPKKHLGCFNGVVTAQCGEIQLYPNEACNLASINLDEFVENGETDWNKLKEVTELATRFLDSAIDVNQLPTKEIQEGVYKTRKLGLGIMGLHGYLIKLGLKYSSLEGRQKATKVMKFIADTSHEYSTELAEEKGVCLSWYGSEFEKQRIKRRNISTNTIAPTGTISMLIDSSSSGCEPIYALAYYRITDDLTYKWVNPLFQEVGEQEGWLTDEVIKKVSDNNGSAKGVKEIPQKWQELFETAMEISPTEHVLMQADLQKYVDNSISKTINLPENATTKEIFDAYILGWKNGLKGMTIYRDKSRDKQVLSLSVNKDKVQEAIESEIPRGYILDTPNDVKGKRRKIKTGCGTLYVKVFYDEYTGELLETFLSKGSTGGCERYMQFASRLISRLLRIGDTPEGILDQASSVGSCPSWMYAVGKGEKLAKGKNCPHAIANTLIEIQKEIKDELGLEESPKTNKNFKVTYNELKESFVTCPECGSKMQTLSGCTTCVSCGFSKCD